MCFYRHIYFWHFILCCCIYRIYKVSKHSSVKGKRPAKIKYSIFIDENVFIFSKTAVHTVVRCAMLNTNNSWFCKHGAKKKFLMLFRNLRGWKENIPLLVILTSGTSIAHTPAANVTCVTPRQQNMLYHSDNMADMSFICGYTHKPKNNIKWHEPENCPYQ